MNWLEHLDLHVYSTALPTMMTNYNHDGNNAFAIYVRFYTMHDPLKSCRYFMPYMQLIDLIIKDKTECPVDTQPCGYVDQKRWQARVEASLSPIDVSFDQTTHPLPAASADQNNNEWFWSWEKIFNILLGASTIHAYGGQRRFSEVFSLDFILCSSLML